MEQPGGLYGPLKAARRSKSSGAEKIIRAFFFNRSAQPAISATIS
jgi:hypothetical protein